MGKHRFHKAHKPHKRPNVISRYESFRRKCVKLGATVKDLSCDLRTTIIIEKGLVAFKLIRYKQEHQPYYLSIWNTDKNVLIKKEGPYFYREAYRKVVTYLQGGKDGKAD